MRVPQSLRCSHQAQISEEFYWFCAREKKLNCLKIEYNWDVHLVDLSHGGGFGVNILPGLGVLLTEVLWILTWLILVFTDVITANIIDGKFSIKSGFLTHLDKDEEVLETSFLEET